MLRAGSVLLSNVGLRQTTSSLHALSSHRWFRRRATQGRISLRALGMFAAINNFLVIFTAHLDESSKTTATLIKK